MRTTKKVELSSAIFAAALIATGCSSSDDGTDSFTQLDDDSGPITQLGTFTLFEIEGGALDANFADAAFRDLPADIAPFSGFFETPSFDRCKADNVFIDEQSAEAAAMIEAGTPVSAGEVLVLSSPLGTFATLLERDGNNLPNYRQDGGIGEVPADLTLDIPGNDFPAFASVAVPSAASIDDLELADDTLSEASEFTWTPTGVANTTLSMNINTGSAIIECDVIDDGSFTLPDEVVSQVGSFTDGLVNFVTVNTKLLEQSGGALLEVVFSYDVPIQ